LQRSDQFPGEGRKLLSDRADLGGAFGDPVLAEESLTGGGGRSDRFEPVSFGDREEGDPRRISFGPPGRPRDRGERLVSPARDLFRGEVRRVLG